MNLDGGKTYCRVCSPKPLLEASERGKTYRRWGGPKTFLGRGFSPNLRYVFHPLSFPPPLPLSEIPIEHFSLDRRFQSRCFYLRGTPGVQRRARSKISIPDRSLEIFNPEGRDRIFSIPGPSGNLPTSFIVPNITSPALQQNFVKIFSFLPGDLALKKGGDFWGIFCGLCFLRNKQSTKNPQNNSGKSRWGLSKWGLKVLVHNCPRLPTTVVSFGESSPLKGAQKATNVRNCGRLWANCRERP